YAFTLPYVAVASTLLYFDLQARQEERAEQRGTASERRRRLAAIGALLAAGGVVVLAVSAFVADMAAMLQGFAAVLVVAVGVWFALTRHGLRRLLAAAVGLAGAAALVVVGIEHWRALSTLGLAGGLVGVFGLAARAASPSEPIRRRARPARRGVLIINPRSGDGKAERFELAVEARKRGIEPILLGPGDDLRALAKSAVERGADVIGMAGG